MICCIVNELNKKMTLDICCNSKSPGASLILYRFHGGANQQFEFREDNIICVNSNLVLEVSGNLSPGSRIVQAKPNGSDKQKFFYKKDGTIQTINGLCFESEHVRTATQGDIILQEPNGCDSQKFRLINNID